MSKATDSEMTPLIGGTWLVQSKSVLSKYSKKVFVTSKAAIVILLWNFNLQLIQSMDLSLYQLVTSSIIPLQDPM